MTIGTITIHDVEHFLNDFENTANIELQGVKFECTTNRFNNSHHISIIPDSICAGVKFTENSRDFLTNLAKKAVHNTIHKEHSDIINALVKTAIDCNELIELCDGLKNANHQEAYKNYFECQLLDNEYSEDIDVIFDTFVDLLKKYFSKVFESSQQFIKTIYKLIEL